MDSNIRLGLNIDHVATIRNARGGDSPDPVRAALLAQSMGVDGITAHLREDRRHIREADVQALRQRLEIPLNLEIAPTDEMVELALMSRPHAVCFVPEKRQEKTTEGGLDAAGSRHVLRPFLARLAAASIRVSLFIEPETPQIEAARELQVPVVEFHTGRYANTTGSAQQAELAHLQTAAQQATNAGLVCHAGHGLTYENVRPIVRIPELQELNIGHFLIGEAIFTGLEASLRRMQALMQR